MRTLFADPLRRLIPLISLIISLTAGAAPPLPSPLGFLSDYGAVLDRHGRERIERRIDEIREGYSVDVYILASWENPFPDIDSYADALFDRWGLNRERTLLAVFLKSGRSWDVRVRASSGMHADYGRLEEGLEGGIADLVYHRRIEEAILSLFDRLERILAPAGGGSPAPSRGDPLTIVAVLLAGAAGVALLIHRRLCPRCGRILRVTVVSERGRERRVYYCRHCGFRRYS